MSDKRIDIRNIFRNLRRFAAHCALVLVAASASADVATLDTYWSPRNKERELRKSTRYIILHTTEGAAKGSGQKLQRNGEAHYMISEDGRIYRIIDRRRIAFHCGKSMWQGRDNLDDCSIGIEVVGYHNKQLTLSQYNALKRLLNELKAYYKITDDRVLTHSMVAYSPPNKWHKHSARGRKRCGMQMASAANRAKFGVYEKPTYDPDVKAKRLIVGDTALYAQLFAKPYSMPKPKPAETPKPKVIVQQKPLEPNVVASGRSPWDIAKADYNKATTLYTFPDKSTKRGNEISNWKTIPAGTRVETGKALPTPPKPPTSATVVTNAVAAEKSAPTPKTTPSTTEEKSAAAAKTTDEVGAKQAADIFAPAATEEKKSAAKTTSSDAEKSAANATTNVTNKLLLTPPTNSPSALAPTFSAGTFLIFTNNTYCRADQLTDEQRKNLPEGSLILTDYKLDGPITNKRPAFNICGTLWNSTNTYYIAPDGAVTRGNEIKPSAIKQNTMILFKPAKP